MRCRARWAVGASVLVLALWIVAAFGAEPPRASSNARGLSPPGVAPQPTAQPGATYDPLRAGEEARQAAEQQRQWAVGRQLWLLDEMRRYNTWAVPYAPGLTEVYAYGSPWALRRAYRAGYGPVFTPWPCVPGDIYGYPYLPWARQPIGHEKVWTGPIGYIYRPLYAAPDMPQSQPPLAPLPGAIPGAPAAPPPAASIGDQAAQPPPIVVPRAAPAAEAIPAPPPEAGPREF